MILHNLLRHKGRTTMSIIAVAISTALLVSLLSVAEGIWQNASYSIISSREDIVIKPQLPSGAGEAWGISNGHKIMNDIKKDTVNISEVSPMHFTFLQIEQLENSTGDSIDQAEPKTGNAISIGIIPKRFKKFFLRATTYNFGIIELTFDNWFKEPGDPHYQNNFTGSWTYEVLVDEHMASEYNLQLDSKINLSTGNNPVTFTVSGIFKTNLESAYFEDFFNIKGIIFLHLSELQSIVGEDVIIQGNKTIIIDKVKTIAISLNDKQLKEKNQKKIAYGIQERYPLLEIVTKEEQLKGLEEQNAMTRVFYTAISIVAIIIGLLFVACIMLISVYERINEIGMLRAIGISKTTIFKWVLLESVLLIIIGILVGFLPGYLGSELLGDYISNDIGIAEDLTAFSLELVVWSFVGMLCIGTVISTIPAFQASRMKIAQALSFVR